MKVSENVWAITHKEGGRVGAYIWRNRIHGLILFDTGVHEYAENIAECIYQEIGEPLTAVKHIFVTHAHTSHIKGLEWIGGWYKAVTYASQRELDIITGKSKMQKVGFKRPKPWNWEVAKLQLGINLGLGQVDPYVTRLDRVENGNLRFGVTCIGTPGHTPGHMSYWIEEEGVLVTGDCVATWPSLGRGWNSFDLDEKQSQRSVQMLGELRGVRVVCPGHGEPITEGAEDILREIGK